ncbi:MAG: ABC transporter substrate-binding protein [Bacteroidaceae bacterium]|nr:ABC transporter substrate-binding protein [Bacteroidaceae bacterium]
MKRVNICVMGCLLMLLPQLLRAGEPFVFTTAWTAQAEFAGYYVAKEKGFYREAGLDVKIQHPSLTSSVYHRMQTDECDAGMFALMAAMDLVGNQQADLVNIFQTSMNSSYLLVSRWGKNPLKQKGMKVAVYNAEPNYLVKMLDKREQMGFKWIYFTSNVNVFLSGAVDAMVVVTYNEYFQLLQAGYTMKEEQLYRFKDHGYNIQENGVYVKRAYFDQHPKEVKAFAEASRRGWEWTAEHPEEALDIVMKYVELDNVPTNRVMQRLMLQEILRLQQDAKSGKREFRVRPDMVKRASGFMQESGLLKREVTYEELMGKKANQ